jgi:hypothetical protein
MIVPATASGGVVGVRTSSSYRCLQDYVPATARHAVGVVDWLVAIPGDGHAVGT